MISSLVAAPRRNSRTTLPFAMTSSRSGTCSASSSSEVANRTASPRFGQLGHQLEDLGLRADVDAARRLVEQQHPRLGEQRLAEHDLLLVAAAQRGDRRAGPLRLDRDVAHHRSTARALRARPTPRGRADECAAGSPSDRFCPTDIDWTSPSRWRSSGTSVDARGRCARRSAARRAAAPSSSHRARRPGATGRRASRAARCARRPSARRGRRSRPRARSARRSSTASRPGLVGSATTSSSTSQQHGARRLGMLAREQLVRLPADHLLDDPREVDVRRPRPRRPAAVAQARRRGRRSRAPPRGDARCRRSPRRAAVRSRMIRNSTSTSAALSADVGSSMISTRASCASARAISTICCCPTRRSPTVVVGSSGSSRRASSSAAMRSSLRRVVDEHPAAARCSRAMNTLSAMLRFGNRLSSWWMITMPRLGGVARTAQHDRLAVELERARRRRLDPGEDLHQRRLAGAVLAEQRRDPARRDGEVDAAQGVGGAEDLVDPAGAHDGERSRSRSRALSS